MKKIFVMLMFVLGLGSLQNTYAEIETRENLNCNAMAGVVLRSNVTLKGPDGTLRLYSNGSFSFMDRNDDRISGTYTIADDHNTLILYVTSPREYSITCSCKMSGGTLVWVKKGEYYYR